ncbi:MAG: UDP-N-acetylmuramate--L-alanine ligase, partial [Burkholderiaceae bacterium]|nr:UDP-N-acetylmuramate--L-alanine ligase [Burkholderiaceae bacterium]
MKHAIKHIHFVGVGGSGMSGIAEVLHNLGYVISGSDLADSGTLRHLAALGIHTAVGHDAAHVQGADAVVTSTAVQPDNPEVLAARARRIPVVPRAVMLAELMRLKRGIAIAGTHGKTTTTSLVTSVLAAAGLDPTFVIGGRLNSAGVNARLGSGEYIVVEADESDASFLNLLPVMAVVTNIDADHMETYGQDFGRLKAAFVDFLHRMPFYGTAILCLESPAVRDILPQVNCPITSYGFGEDAQVQAVDVRTDGAQMRFTVLRRNGHSWPDLPVTLNLAGRHNVLNALAAIAVAGELGVADQAIQQALAEFKGVGRRFQRWGDWPARDGGAFTLIDDYGHHPAEMAATVAAARGAFPGRRLLLAFQPHRYTRTRDCFEDLVQVLGSADALALTEVYAAGEAPIARADGRALARALRVAGK